MPIPIKLTTPDGFTFEVESLDQAVVLKQRLGSLASRQPRSQLKAPAEQKRTVDVMTAPTAALLDVLWKAINGLTTDEAAMALQVNPKSIPPLVRNLHTWCAERRLKLDDLLTRTPRYVNRKAVTQYQLTEQGRETFMSIVVKHGLNGVKPKEEPKATA